jgi:hypothetical protein
MADAARNPLIAARIAASKGIMSAEERQKQKQQKAIKKLKNTRKNRLNEERKVGSRVVSTFITTQGATSIVSMLAAGANVTFGPAALNAIKDKNPGLVIRDMFESLPAPEQCTKVIGLFSQALKASKPETQKVSEQSLITNLQTIFANKSKVAITEEIPVFQELSSKFSEDFQLQVNYMESTCWICGEQLAPLGSKGVFFGLAPECEHILPVIQAAIFLELYGKRHSEIKMKMQKAITIIKNAKKITTEVLNAMKIYLDNKPALQRSLNILIKEYAWAHAGCNRIKSNQCFIIPNNELNAASINTALITAFLKDIFMDNTHIEIINVQAMLQRKYLAQVPVAITNPYERLAAAFNLFCVARMPTFVKKLNTICYYINSCDTNDPGCKPDFEKICIDGALTLFNKDRIGELSVAFQTIQDKYEINIKSTEYLNFCKQITIPVQTLLEEKHKHLADNFGTQIQSQGLINLKTNFIDIDNTQKFNISNILDALLMRTFTYISNKSDIEPNQFYTNFIHYIVHNYYYLVYANIAKISLFDSIDIKGPQFIGTYEPFNIFVNTILEKSYTLASFKDNLTDFVRNLPNLLNAEKIAQLNALQQSLAKQNLPAAPAFVAPAVPAAPAPANSLKTELTAISKNIATAIAIIPTTELDKSTKTGLLIAENGIQFKIQNEASDILTTYIQSSTTFISPTDGETQHYLHMTPAAINEIKAQEAKINVSEFLTELCDTDESALFDNITIDDLYNNDVLAAKLLMAVINQMHASMDVSKEKTELNKYLGISPHILDYVEPVAPYAMPPGGYGFGSPGAAYRMSGRVPIPVPGAGSFGPPGAGSFGPPGAGSFGPPGAEDNNNLGGGGKRSPKKSTHKRRHKRHIKTRKHRKIRK